MHSRKQTMLHRIKGLVRGLQFRLALSHALPVLVFVPLLGFVLLFQLERRFLLDNLAVELAAQGAIIAEFIADEPLLLQNRTVAQLALAEVSQRMSAHLMLLDSSGRIIAANWFETAPTFGLPIESSVVGQALRGQAAWNVNYALSLDAEVIDVAVPITGPRGSIIGAIRLSATLDEIRRRLVPVRWVVLLTVVLGTGAALVVGTLLARSLGRPLIRLSDAVASFTPTAPPQPVGETGPHEVKLLAENFNRLSRRLYELERTRSALLSGIVHELGRPMGAIKAAAQTIANSDDTELNTELAQGIDVQIDRLRLHLDDLVLLGEMEVQGLTLRYGPVDIAALLSERCRQFAHIAAEKDINLHCTAAENLPIIQADAQRIGQVVDNLIDNACKYSPHGGTVDVSVNVDPTASGSVLGPGIIVQIADNGPGIAPAEQEEVFRMFYRSPSQRRVHEGMGIGLALARQLVEAHGGRLSVASAIGNGATFTLRLPAIPPPHDAVQKSLSSS